MNEQDKKTGIPKEVAPGPNESKAFSIEKALQAQKEKRVYHLIEFELTYTKGNPETEEAVEITEKFDIKVTQFERTAKLLDTPEMRAIMGKPNQEDADFVDVPEHKRIYLTALNVLDKGSKALGRITGVVEFSGTQFVNFHIVNFAKEGKFNNQETRHVPGVMKEAIVQLILQKVFDIWYSSMILTQDGNAIYEKIRDEGRVDVDKDAFYDGKDRWKVTYKVTRLPRA